MIDLSTKRVCVTGGNGFLGRQIVAKLVLRDCKNISVPCSKTYDLRMQNGVRRMLMASKPDIVIHAAAHAGGIGLNRERPAELFYDNALMGILMMDEAYKWGVEKYVQIGTICSYPKYTPTPFREKDLWLGYPEETNAPYGLAKKMLLVQAQAYRQQYGFNAIYLMPVNMYGPGDNFSPDSSHVIPALVKKFADAREARSSSVTLWGTGQASREFLYVKDAAEAVIKATELYDGVAPINVGSGSEITVEGLARMIAEKIGYKGEIVFDSTKPDGQPRRCLNVELARLWFGFDAETSLEVGLDTTIKWYYNRPKE